MIKLMNFVMPYSYTKQQLYKAVAKRLKTTVKDIENIQYLKKSIDARKKPQIFIVLTLLLQMKQETLLLKRFSDDCNIQKYTPYRYAIPSCPSSSKQPVVVGFGPAGMFAAFLLAKAGLQPLVLERGMCVEQRKKDVELFRQTGRLNPFSNVQFGEGGAGTFSDGKLTTGIKDPRIRFVLETFVSCGAPEEILYLAKPHIGTDRLTHVVREMRKTIQNNGGEIQFGSCLKNLVQENGTLTGLIYEKDGVDYQVDAQQCILAIGHSARDTFLMLYKNGIFLTQKNFAVGVRIEHPQRVINDAMYGDKTVRPPNLPAADYKLVEHLPNGRSLYTFCMCPGGEVIAASSEPNHLVVNGMSNYVRDGKNANSALLVGVSSNELQSSHPLAGIAFQRQLEMSAFLAGGANYNAPVCSVRDFLKKQTPQTLGDVQPTYLPGVMLALPDQYLPEFVTQTLRLGIQKMDRKIHGFAMADAVLTGIESRSSSPVRIVRGETFESVSLKGLYPCGEGAGYAGGITSAAVDGLRCAEQIITKK